MKTILIDKILAILVTSYFIFRNEERTSNYVGGFLILAFGLTLLGIGVLTSIAVILYLITIGGTIWLLLTGRVKSDIGILASIFLLGIIIKGIPLLLYFPDYEIFTYLSIGLTVIYFYFILIKKASNILVVTSIPAMDCIITLTGLLD